MVAIHIHHSVVSSSQTSSQEFLVARTTTMTTSSAHGKKQVRFALEKDYEVYLVPHFLTYDTSHREELWWTRQEYKVIRDNIKRMANILEQRRSTSSSYQRRRKPSDMELANECTRGLEKQTQRGNMMKKMACRNGIQAVLAEQESQVEMDVCNEDAIRTRYMEASRANVDAAIEQGRKDAAYNEDDDDLRANLQVIDSRRIIYNSHKGDSVQLRSSSGRNNNARIRRLFHILIGTALLHDERRTEKRR